MKDRNWTLSDLRFIARKREFWAACAVGVVVGAVLGYLA